MKKLFFILVCNALFASAMDSNSCGVRVPLVPAPKDVELKSGIIVPYDEVTKVMANLKALDEDQRFDYISKYWLFCELEEHIDCMQSPRYPNHVFFDFDIPILKEKSLIDLEHSISQITAHVIRSAVRTNNELRKVIIQNPVRKILSYKDLP